jgi:hypothetical protein
MLFTQSSFKQPALKEIKDKNTKKGSCLGFRMPTHLVNHVGFRLTLKGWWVNPNPTRQPVLLALAKSKIA